MSSGSYHQQSAYDEHDAAIDPENEYLWRCPPRRLEAEAIRDTMLAVSDTLDTSMYGPGTWSSHTPSQRLFHRQTQPTDSHDAALRLTRVLVGMGTRSQTTTAPQALMLLNSAFARQAAETLPSGLRFRAVTRCKPLSKKPVGGRSTAAHRRRGRRHRAVLRGRPPRIHAC